MDDLSELLKKILELTPYLKCYDLTPQQQQRQYWRMRYCRGHRKPKRPLPEWVIWGRR